jgi:hypothetical protein
VGRQIDQAVGKLQQQAKEAESRLGDRLIEAGEMLKEKPESASDAER